MWSFEQQATETRQLTLEILRSYHHDNRLESFVSPSDSQQMSAVGTGQIWHVEVARFVASVEDLCDDESRFALTSDGATIPTATNVHSSHPQGHRYRGRECRTSRFDCSPDSPLKHVTFFAPSSSCKASHVLCSDSRIRRSSSSRVAVGRHPREARF